MLSIGDVFSVVAILFGTAFSAWALLLGSAMLFSRKARISEGLVRHAPGRSFALGLIMLLVIGIVSLAFLAVPIPLIKLIGWSGILVVLSLATLGAGGLVLVIADRLRTYDPKLRPFVALNRAALFIVVAGLAPFIGWFVIFPAVLAIGMGTGTQSLFMREFVTEPISEYPM